jgi:hypothetical protein
MIVRDRRTGEFITVARDPYTGQLVRIDPRLAEPGSLDLRQEQELWDSLPAADVRGFDPRAPGIVPGGEPAIRRQPEPAGPAPVPTFRPLNGAAQNNRGRVIELPPAAAGLAVAESIIETPTSCGDDAEQMVVTLGLDWVGQADGAMITLPVEIFCDLVMGIGGATFQARVDWLRGGRFSVNASFLRVGATYVSVPAGFGATPPTARLSAAIGYGDPRSESHPARFTQRGFGPSLAAGGTVNVPIPRWASACSPLLADSLRLSMRTNTGVTQFVYATYDYNSFSNTANQGVAIFPIPTNSNFILVQNTGLAPLSPAGFNMIWHMAL